MQYLLLGVGCVLIVDALVGDRGLLALLQARKNFQALDTSVARLRADNNRLREAARRLREDPAAIEDLARREHNMIFPGEKLFIITDEDTTKPSRPGSESPIPNPQSQH